MRVIIGSDHAGFRLKESIKDMLKKAKLDYEDIGASSEESVDYPLYAGKVAKEVARGKGIGILICGTGVGMCIAANKVKGIRAALCKDEAIAEKTRQHNDANILCLAGSEADENLAKRIVRKFLETPFSKEERHQRRIKEIAELEK